MKPGGTLSLKEWASVSEALALGDQVLLLRRGGVDNRRGFEIAGTAYLLFATAQREHGTKVRPERMRRCRPRWNPVRA